MGGWLWFQQTPFLWLYKSAVCSLGELDRRHPSVFPLSFCSTGHKKRLLPSGVSSPTFGSTGWLGTRAAGVSGSAAAVTAEQPEAAGQPSAEQLTLCRADTQLGVNSPSWKSSRVAAAEEVEPLSCACDHNSSKSWAAKASHVDRGN